MPSPRLGTMCVLSRGARARCPACGLGHVFRRGITPETACAFCGRLFERCPGHWIGGAEIDLIASFTVGALAFVPAALVLGLCPLAAAIATAATGVFSVAFYRPSRGLFIALDYLADPTDDGPSPSAADPDDLDDG